MRALVVDDEKLIVKGLKFNLEQEGYEVDCAYDGQEAVDLAKENEYDIILLDLMLPVFDGYEVCQQVREFSDVPIVMLTAKSEDADKVMGLTIGADDYITKPFNPVELMARVKSQLRRYTMLGSQDKADDSSLIRIGGIEMNDKSKEVSLDGNPVSLTPLEYDILKLLMIHAGEVLSPKDIYEKVWNETVLGAESTVAVHIRHLREKLEYDSANPRYLKAVWGHGYKMDGEA